MQRPRGLAIASASQSHSSQLPEANSSDKASVGQDFLKNLTKQSEKPCQPEEQKRS